MNWRVKGYAANPVVIGVVCLAVGVVIGAGGMWYYMSTHQGGLGDSEDAGLLQSETLADAALEETAEITEPPSTEPVTENLSYIRVVVTGNDYVYKGEIFSLEGILAIVRTNPDLPIRISDESASLHAYDALIEALDEAGAQYVEANT